MLMSHGMQPSQSSISSLASLFDFAGDPATIIQIAAVVDTLPLAFGIAERSGEHMRFLYRNQAAAGVFPEEALTSANVVMQVLPTPSGCPERVLCVDTSCNAEARARILTKRWKLTRRKAAVLLLAAQGAANKEIGSTLGLAESTVEMHLTALFKVAEVQSRAALVAAFWTS